MNKPSFITRRFYEVYRLLPGNKKVRVALFESYPDAMEYLKEFDELERKTMGVDPKPVSRSFVTQ